MKEFRTGLFGLLTVGSVVVLLICAIMEYRMIARDDETAKEPQGETVAEAAEDKTPDEPVYVTLSEDADATEFSVIGTSIKKDLTLYFTDKSDRRIEGAAFSIKLVKESRAAKLSEASDVIRRDSRFYRALTDAEIAELTYTTERAARISDVLETYGGDTDMAAADLAALKDEPLFLSTGETDDPAKLIFDAETKQPITLGDWFLLRQNENITAYEILLSKTKGKVYHDDDEDGIIYIPSVKAGNYVSCVLPAEGYRAMDLAVDVRVRTKLAYTPISNIELKTVSEELAGDIEPEEFLIEATAIDTTPYVESRTVTNADGSVTYFGWQTVDDRRYYFDANGNPVVGDQVILGVRYAFGTDGALLTGGFGIDVSKWQGHIDWALVAPNISFTIIRCGFRGTAGGIAEDPMFRYNIEQAKESGLRVGVYFYTNALNEAQAVEEASLAVALLNEVGGCDLPVYIDMEDATQRVLTNEQRTAIVLAFCETVRAAGYQPGVYASYSWLLNDLDMNAILQNGISVWCARYNTECGLPYPYDAWQYSSRGTLPGIDGWVDMNIGF